MNRDSQYSICWMVKSHQLQDWQRGPHIQGRCARSQVEAAMPLKNAVQHCLMAAPNYTSAKETKCRDRLMWGERLQGHMAKAVGRVKGEELGTVV